MANVIGKKQCPKCASNGLDRSHDNLILYSNNSSFCFSCGYYTRSPEYQREEEDLEIESIEQIKELNSKSFRGIPQDVIELYGVKTEFDPATGAEQNYFYPRYKEGMHTGYWKRILPKTFIGVGDCKKSDLFGQHLRQAGGKFIVVTEAQDDAMAAFEMIRKVVGKPYAVVGSWGTNGWSNGVEYLSTFEKVIISFDNDKPGQAAAQQLAESLPPGKAFIAKHSMHDANEMLLANKYKEYWEECRSAKPVKYGGIISGRETWDLITNRSETQSFSYPEEWGELQNKTGGRRLGQITLWSSGSGSGKSFLLRNLRYHDLVHNPEVVAGVISLEDPLIDEVDNMVGLHMGRRFLNEARPWEIPGYKDAWEFTHGHDKIFYYETGGDAVKDADSLVNKIRYMATVLGCNDISLDHMQLAIAEMQADGEELKEAHMMSKLINVVKETNVHLNLVSQLRKPLNGNKSWENGDMPTVNDLFGSSSIKQGSADIIFFGRNQQAEDKLERNRISLAVGKCRRTGDTGPAGMVQFESNTGRIVEYQGDF